MTELFHFHGRGHHGIAADSLMLIEPDEGAVLGVTVQYGQAEFMVAYCRKALADRWGLYCDSPFRRASTSDLSEFWAEPLHHGLFLYRSVRIHLVREETWMTRSSDGLGGITR